MAEGFRDDAQKISAGAEAVGLPPTLPAPEAPIKDFPLGSMENPVSAGFNSQAGLASARVRLGGSAPSESGEEVAAAAADIARDKIDTSGDVTREQLETAAAKPNRDTYGALLDGKQDISTTVEDADGPRPVKKPQDFGTRQQELVHSEIANRADVAK